MTIATDMEQDVCQLLELMEDPARLHSSSAETVRSATGVRLPPGQVSGATGATLGIVASWVGF